MIHFPDACFTLGCMDQPNATSSQIPLPMDLARLAQASGSSPLWMSPPGILGKTPSAVPTGPSRPDTPLRHTSPSFQNHTLDEIRSTVVDDTAYKSKISLDDFIKNLLPKLPKALDSMALSHIAEKLARKLEKCKSWKSFSTPPHQKGTFPRMPYLKS